MSRATPIRVLVVDDEAPARQKLRRLLDSEPDFEIVGEARDGLEAVELIRAEPSDLVFLDVQMPGLDGFGVVRRVGVEAMPLVVFVTAHDEHALRAFEVQALDYLLKPYAPPRLGRVLDQVRQRLAGPAAQIDAPPLNERLEQLLSDLRPPESFVRQLLVERAKDREVLLPVEAIDRVRAERNYLRFFGPRGEFRRRGTLRELEGRLDPSLFLRINRSEIVRLDAVDELQPWFHGDYRVLMKDGTRLSWSRRYRARAKGIF